MGSIAREFIRRVSHVVTPLLLSVLVASLAALGSACNGSSAPSAQHAVVPTPVDPATAGTIHVQVNYTGTPPKPKLLEMRGAPQCTAAHGEPVYDPSVTVQDGHLANAVVWIKSGLDKWVFAPASAPILIDQKGCVYQPHVAAAMVGQTVQFRNDDIEAHNVHGRPQILSAWNFMMSRQGMTRQMTFDKPEIAIPIGCDIHPWMAGFLAVLPNPYFGVTPAATGTVVLKNVPPGNYVVAVWHEKLGSKEQPVALSPSGSAAVQVTFGANG